MTTFMRNGDFIMQLKERLSGPLPGQPAQLKMTFAWRAEQLRMNPEPPPDARVAGVLLALWHDDLEWKTVLIQRTQNPRDRHSGQVSFPGGKHEEADGDISRTAVREAHEEVGITPENIDIIGKLTELYIPVSNFVVHPYVGILHEKPVIIPQPGEVEAVYTPPVSHFRDEKNKSLRELRVGTGVIMKYVPCYLVENRAVWGATAMILSEFTELIDQP
jgi:8-oxo-dGTP pyrophosphatase MutT (NUDIX family)